MTLTYGIVEERYIFRNNWRVSYGIVAYADIESDGSATIVGAVHDITSDYFKLYGLVQECNSLLLSLNHLIDVVEDFLAE